MTKPKVYIKFKKLKDLYVCEEDRQLKYNMKVIKTDLTTTATTKCVELLCKVFSF